MGLEMAKAFIRIATDWTQFDKDMRGGQQRTTRGLTSMVSLIQGHITRALAGIGSMMGIYKGLKIAGTQEQNIIAFETLMGSIDDAKALLEDLSDFAAKTPFRMGGIIQSARGLVQFGENADQVMDTLHFLGNAAAGTSTDFQMLALIYNQVRGVGKLLTQDFRQMSTRGVVSLKDFANHFNITLQEAQERLSKGKISFEDLRDVLKGLSDEGGRFHNLMEKQSTSLLGLWSTLQEELEFTARDMMKPFMPMLKSLQSAMIKAASAFRQLIDPNIMRTLGAIVAGIGAFKLAVMGLSFAFKPLTLSILAVVAATKLLVPALEKASTFHREELEKTRELNQERMDQFDRLVELKEKQELNSAEMSEATNIIAGLTHTYGDLGLSMDEVTGKIEIQMGAWGRLTEAARRTMLVRLKNTRLEMQNERDQIKKQMDDQKAVEKVFEEQKFLRPPTPREMWQFAFTSGEEVANRRKEYEKLGKEILKITQTIKKGEISLVPEKLEEEESERQKQKERAERQERMKKEHELQTLRVKLQEEGWAKERNALALKHKQEIEVAEEAEEDVEHIRKRHSLERLNLWKNQQKEQEAIVEELNQKQEKRREKEKKDAKSFMEGFRTPAEEAADKVKEIMEKPALTEEQRLKALKRFRKDIEPKLEITGQIGFAEFGKRIQEALLRDDPNKETAKNTKEMAKVLHKIDENTKKLGGPNIAVHAP
jgi:tape measure domain-containing protein